MLCRACSCKSIDTVIDFGLQPIVHHYLQHQEQTYPLFPFILESCNNCGFMQIKEPIDPGILYANYFTVSGWKYQPHMRRLVELILEKANIPLNAAILEIGCNDGTFLKLLKDAGFNNLLGIEPTADASRLALAKDLDVLKGFLSPVVAHSLVESRGKFDLLIIRQALEHIADLDGFRLSIQSMLKPRGYIAIDVPDTWLNLSEPDYALWEEHVNYFTIESLKRYLSSCGIQLIHDESTIFSGRCLTAIGQYTGNVQKSLTNDIDKLSAAINRYRELWPVFRESLREYLLDLKAQGHRIAVYGTGARSSTVVNFSEIGHLIEFFVDDQEEKQGLWVPGCKLSIRPGHSLYEERITFCLLGVNKENESKVMEKHKEWTKNGGIFRSILPPSDMLINSWPFDRFIGT